MGRYVLDAFAVLALFNDEPGAPRVESILREAQAGRDDVFLTVVNLGESLYRLHQDRGPDAPGEAYAEILQWPVTLVVVDQDLALAASSHKALRKIGYMDAFAVALADRLRAVVITGDHDFDNALDVIEVEWLPQRPR
jgi:PIN domain nuclease of toxin-antitoxin system